MSGSDGKKRLVKSRSGLRVVNLEGSCSSPFELSEPFWIPDQEISYCTKCHIKFDFLTRKHHCRRCGNIFCNDCCEQKLPLPRMCFVDPVRLCAECVDITKKENEFYDKHLKILLNGANFFLNNTEEPDGNISFLCCLSTDQQAILFDGGSAWQHNPLSLHQVVTLKVLGTISSPGLSQVTGATLQYIDANEQEREIGLSVANVPNRKQSVAWIMALQKALKFIRSTPETP